LEKKYRLERIIEIYWGIFVIFFTIYILSFIGVIIIGIKPHEIILFITQFSIYAGISMLVFAFVVYLVYHAWVLITGN